MIGGSVIDFEPLPLLRILFNFHHYHFDVCSSQLYVNRRGAPSNKQFGYFDLDTKIRLYKAIINMGNRSNSRFFITETNWPLLNTKPYTPNSGDPRSTASEEEQASYLRDYFKIAWSTGCVERVYWWQLVSPGYGLVDNRHHAVRKMPSFYALKQMLSATSMDFA